MKTIKYEKIADHVRSLLDSGSLRVGDKLPSIRELKSKMGVSASTIVEAYRRLEASGLIEAKPRSGYIVRSKQDEGKFLPKTLKTISSTIALNTSEFITEILHQGHDPEATQLGVAELDTKLLPVEELRASVTSSMRRAGARILEYDRLPGCIELRRQLAVRSLSWGVKISPDEIIITSGAMDALSIAIQSVASPGDTIAVESPTFFGILQLLESFRLNVVEVPVHSSFGPDLDVLEKVAVTQQIKAFIVVPNFQNPTGSLMSDVKKKDLALMANRYNFAIIEDDIYSDLYFGKRRPITIKSFDINGWVLLCSSVSKSLAPGFRIGWIAPGERFFKRAESIKATVSGETATLPQLAIADFMRLGHYDKHLRKLRDQLQFNIAMTRKTVFKSFPQTTRISDPSGGFVLWLELNSKINTLDLFQKMATDKIIFSPGSIFSARKGFKSFIRLSCGKKWSKEIEDAVSAIGRAM